MKDFPVKCDTILLAALQDVQQLGFFRGKVFFWIDAAVNGEPAFRRDNVEVCSASALSAKHQYGVTRLLRTDIESRCSRFHFALQLLQLFNNGVHPFKCIFTLMLQTHVRRLAKHAHAQGKGATIRIPHHAARWFRQEHSDAAPSEQSLLCQPRCAIQSARFFIGDQRQSDAAFQFHPDFFQRADCIEHCYDSALHVCGATPKQKMLFPLRLKLCRGLRRDHVVMPVKIECGFSTAVGRDQTLGRIRGIISRNARSQALTIKTHLPQVGLQKIHTNAIVFTWRIFRWDSDKVPQQRRHLVLAVPQPRKNRGALRRHVVPRSVHRRECQEFLQSVPRSILVPSRS